MFVFLPPVKRKLGISENIRLIRESQGYSQDYVAIKLDITQQAYSAIEKNPERATLSRLKEIATILQVPLVTLLGEDDISLQPNFHQARGNLAKMYKDVSSESEVYDKWIAELKEEVLFLRKLVSGKM
ncbi:MAG: helix-turn-helix transcriptional regulator, partial [Bacteroidetes bacterium]|nr:helix-turn-helix transcriptional regulator [Bacteroidota bacterium]